MTLLTDTQISDRLDRWFGLKFADYPRGMVEAIRRIVDLNPDDRARTVSAFGAFFCTHCGGEPGCQCWNDE